MLWYALQLPAPASPARATGSSGNSLNNLASTAATPAVETLPAAGFAADVSGAPGPTVRAESPGTPANATGPVAKVREVTPAPARLGVVASRSAVGNAVQRARAKRRLREVFRHHQLRVPAGYDLLLVARGALNRLEYREIEKRFVDACSKIFPSAKA